MCNAARGAPRPSPVAPPAAPRRSVFIYYRCDCLADKCGCLEACWKGAAGAGKVDTRPGPALARSFNRSSARSARLRARLGPSGSRRRRPEGQQHLGHGQLISARLRRALLRKAAGERKGREVTTAHLRKMIRNGFSRGWRGGAASGESLPVIEGFGGGAPRVAPPRPGRPGLAKGWLKAG